MLYTGKAICEKHGIFDWQIAEGENNKMMIGKDFITKNVKDYNKNLKLVIANCPKCGCKIEITDYNFDNTN